MPADSARQEAPLGLSAQMKIWVGSAVDGSRIPPGGLVMKAFIR